MITTDVFVSFSSKKVLFNSAGKHIDVMLLGQQNGQRNERFMANKNTLTVLKNADVSLSSSKRVLCHVFQSQYVVLIISIV